jgi:UDP-glucose 4-epimerase
VTRVAVTGGGGFIGAYLVRRLVELGWDVTVVDTMIRGDAGRLSAVVDQIRLVDADVRDEEALGAAFAGADVVMHLAAINGTENFYSRPELVLDVGIRGAIAVVNACRNVGVPDLVVASTAEVYQTPSIVPTPETIALMLPDSLNPRYSYGGSKIASELIAFNYAQEHFRKVQVFRPHNVYGPDMGWKHVIPQFIVRADSMRKQAGQADSVRFPIQGDGRETRAFCFVDDVVEGIVGMYAAGGHREIYHIGNDQEISIAELVALVGQSLGVTLEVEPSAAAAGGTPRRCPDISKMRALGYQPQVSLADGLARTADWYLSHPTPPTANDLL